MVEESGQAIRRWRGMMAQARVSREGSRQGGTRRGDAFRMVGRRRVRTEGEQRFCPGSEEEWRDSQVAKTCSLALQKSVCSRRVISLVCERGLTVDPAPAPLGECDPEADVVPREVEQVLRQVEPELRVPAIHRTRHDVFVLPKTQEEDKCLMLPMHKCPPW